MVLFLLENCHFTILSLKVIAAVIFLYTEIQDDGWFGRSIVVYYIYLLEEKVNATPYISSIFAIKACD